MRGALFSLSIMHSSERLQMIASYIPMAPWSLFNRKNHSCSGPAANGNLGNVKYLRGFVNAYKVVSDTAEFASFSFG